MAKFLVFAFGVTLGVNGAGGILNALDNESSRRFPPLENSSISITGFFFMGRPKAEVNKALSPAHLQGIGAVAAAWSSLEFVMLIVIAKVAKIDTFNTIVLTGSSNMSVWIDTLTKLTYKSDEHRHKLDDLEPIFKVIRKLSTKRNNVVHASWHPDKVGTVLQEITVPVTRTSKAKGIGIPKRGTKPVIEIEHTAAEMRSIAKEIAECQSTLFSWLLKETTKARRNKLAELLQAHANPGQKSANQNHQL